MKPTAAMTTFGAGCAAILMAGNAAGADDNSASEDDLKPANLPIYLQDRRNGIPTSVGSVYVQDGEVLTLVDLQYNRDHDFEYDPREFGFSSPVEGESKGHYWDSSVDVLVAYGLNDDMALEIEAAASKASLEKADDDLSNMPNELKESGLGNVRARLDWRLLEENERRPEVFTYIGVLAPHNSSDHLIGTPDWVANAGAGVVRGYDWGTITFRMGLEYDLGSASELDWGEVALEYLKRLSPEMTVYGAVKVFEGDEYSLVGELQWHLSPSIILKLNSGVGLTSHGMDFSPRIGVLFSFAD